MSINKWVQEDRDEAIENEKIKNKYKKIEAKQEMYRKLLKAEYKGIKAEIKALKRVIELSQKYIDKLNTRLYKKFGEEA